MFADPFEDEVHGFGGHDLAARGAGAHMAVDTGEVAEFAHVDLEDTDGFPLQPTSVAGEDFVKGIHGVFGLGGVKLRAKVIQRRVSLAMRGVKRVRLWASPICRMASAEVG